MPWRLWPWVAAGLFEGVVFLDVFGDLPGALHARRESDQITAAELLGLAPLRGDDELAPQDVADLRLAVLPLEGGDLFAPDGPVVDPLDLQLHGGGAVLAEYLQIAHGVRGLLFGEGRLWPENRPQSVARMGGEVKSQSLWCLIGASRWLTTTFNSPMMQRFKLHIARVDSFLETSLNSWH